MDPPAADENIVAQEELHQLYVNFWNSLNNCVDEDDKLVPANGVEPTFEEAKNLWKLMKKPVQRKLLWVATGFLHSEFPEDEEQFRQEENAGIIFETNVTTGVDDTDDESSDDDVDVEANAQPVTKNDVDILAINRLVGDTSPALVDISLDEDTSQTSVIANDAVNASGVHHYEAYKPESLESPTIEQPFPSDNTSILSQMDSMAFNLPLEHIAAVPVFISPAAIPFSSDIANNIAADSDSETKDEIVCDEIDHFMEQPIYSPSLSPVHNSAELAIDLSYTPAASPELVNPSSLGNNNNTSKGKSVVIENNSDGNTRADDVSEEVTHMNEQMASVLNKSEKAKSQTKRKRRKKSTYHQSSTSEPRFLSRDAVREMLAAQNKEREREKSVDPKIDCGTDGNTKSRFMELIKELDNDSSSSDSNPSSYENLIGVFVTDEECDVMVDSERQHVDTSSSDQLFNAVPLNAIRVKEFSASPPLRSILKNRESAAN